MRNGIWSQHFKSKFWNFDVIMRNGISNLRNVVVVIRNRILKLQNPNAKQNFDIFIVRNEVFKFQCENSNWNFGIEILWKYQRVHRDSFYDLAAVSAQWQTMLKDIEFIWNSFWNWKVFTPYLAFVLTFAVQGAALNLFQIKRK